MSIEHTPGPWKVGTVGDIWAATPVGKTGKPRHGRGTEDICQGSKYSANWKKDAALVAAAPDLLEALEAIANDAEDASEPNGLTKWIVTTARAAIKAARGES
jgi:hypothetical protein